jgi:Protein of unknown function (DUF642)
MKSTSNRAKIAGGVALAALAVALCVPTAASAAPFSDGTFATPSHGQYATITAPSMFGPWKVTAGSVDHGTAPGQTTCVSNQCVDLNGNAPGAISQTFDSSCKPTYHVTFKMSRHKLLGDSNTPAKLQAWANGNPILPIFEHNVAGVSPADGKWEPHNFSFPGAAGASQTIEFRSVAPTSGAAGPQIDDVVVTAACS